MRYLTYLQGFMVKLLLAAILLGSLSSCRIARRIFDSDSIAAQVGDQFLYRKEVAAVIPKGVSSSDSLNMAHAYILSWAKDHIYLQTALDNLPKADQDVSRELEDYRRSLLKYRYEQHYVNERLDTAISEAQVKAYYNAHLENFVCPQPILKARFMRIDKNSNMLWRLRNLMKSDSAEDLVELDTLCRLHADRFTLYDMEWIDASILASDFGSGDYSSLVTGTGYIDRTKDSFRCCAFVTDYLPTGSIAPLEYCSEQIKDMILSERNRKLILSLEQDLLESARRSGKFKVY